MLAKIANLWNTEPAVILGIAGSIIVFAVEQFAGHGISTADTSTNVQNLVQALIPLIVSLVTRTQVSPA